VSRNESMFVDCGASMMMDEFGSNSIVYRSLAQQQATPVGSTTLDWCSLGIEIRRTRQRDYGLEVYYERHGWVITDTESSEYCGVDEIQISGQIVDGDRGYKIDEAKRQESGKIVNFRCFRVDWVESRKSDLRGR
jgi:hypothetical protein